MSKATASISSYSGALTVSTGVTKTIKPGVSVRDSKTGTSVIFQGKAQGKTQGEAQDKPKKKVKDTALGKA